MCGVGSEPKGKGRLNVKEAQVQEIGCFELACTCKDTME